MGLCLQICHCCFTKCKICRRSRLVTSLTYRNELRSSIYLSTKGSNSFIVEDEGTAEEVEEAGCMIWRQQQWQHTLDDVWEKSFEVQQHAV